MVSKAPLLALLAGCVAPERVDLPPDLDRYRSMVFAVTSGDALRITAHELPLDAPLEPWTASEPVTFVAFLYEEPLGDLAVDIERGTLLDFQDPSGQPIPGGSMTLVNRAEDDELTGWEPVSRLELPKNVGDFRLPPRSSSCPQYRTTPIPLPCEKTGEHAHDSVVMMLPAGPPGEAYVTTSRGCAFLVRGEEAIRVEDPVRPYVWLSGLQTGEGRFIVTGDDASLVDFTITGTTVAASSRAISVPDRNDHPVLLGGAPGELYAATFHGALWKNDGSEWRPLVDAPLDPDQVCDDPYAECHAVRSIVLLEPGELLATNFREDEILRVVDGMIFEEQIDQSSIPGGVLTSKLVSALMAHSKHGLLSAYGSLPAPILRRDDGGIWRFFEQSSASFWIYVMRELGDGIFFCGQQGRIGYLEQGLDCGTIEQAQGELHHLIPLGDGAYLTGGDPQGLRGTLAVYRIELIF